MRAIVSVFGKNRIGIMCEVTSACAKYKADIIDIKQTLIDDYFAMYMIVNIDQLTIDFIDFVDKMSEEGKQKGLKIHVMHEEIFDMMHHI